MRRLLTAAVGGVCALTVIAAGALAGCGASRQRAVSQPGVTPPRVNCGSAAARALGDQTELLSAEPGALPCFDAAIRNCRAASLSVLAMGVDAGTRYYFVIKPGTDPCQVTERSQSYMVSGGVHHGPVTTTSCQVAAAAAGGVTLSCNGRQILIPATAGQGRPPI